MAAMAASLMEQENSRVIRGCSRELSDVCAAVRDAGTHLVFSRTTATVLIAREHWKPVVPCLYCTREWHRRVGQTDLRHVRPPPH